MILVDTSVWIDHLRKADRRLQRLLDHSEVLTHSFVIGELAMGNLRQREVVIATLQELPQAKVAYENEVLHFVAQHELFGSGIGYVDAHLLASARLAPGTLLWTRDKRLAEIAAALSLGFYPGM